jgi:hypothetical protein
MHSLQELNQRIAYTIGKNRRSSLLETQGLETFQTSFSVTK